MDGRLMDGESVRYIVGYRQHPETYSIDHTLPGKLERRPLE